nr:uncharacterized protein LOC106687786 [Halyomorpha halys]
MELMIKLMVLTISQTYILSICTIQDEIPGISHLAAKKVENQLIYSSFPDTYRSRPRRAPGLAPPIDVAEVEKQLVAEMGEKVCIYEQICEHYALQSLQPDVDAILDWEQIFRKFATSSRDDAEFYLLSIFLGDIVGSPHLCRQLAKRGRSCKGSIPLTSAYNPINLDNRVQTARMAPQQSQAVSWQYYYAPNAPQITALSPR